MPRLFRLSIVVICLGLILSSATTHALTKGFEVDAFRPNTDGAPYFSVWGSRNLDQWEWEAGTMASYAYRPFQLSRGSTRVQGIVDYTVVQHFLGGIGFLDRWLSMGVDIPMGWFTTYQNPNVAGSPRQNEMVVEDIRVYLKSELFRSKYLGIAVLPFASIPTGYGRYFFGNGTFAGGGKVILEGKPFERWSIALNAGVFLRQSYTFMNDIRKDGQILLDLGTAVRVWKGLSVTAEINTEPRLRSPFSRKVETPTEARAGLRWEIGNTGLLASVGGGLGIIRSSGSPRFRVLAGISYSPRRRPKHFPTDALSLDIIPATVVHFATDSAAITDVKDAQELGVVADALTAHPDTKIRVIGHTDATGKRRENERLSQERAEKVKWYINLHGIADDRMEAVGVGSSQPADSGKTPWGRAKNRRVNMEIEKP